jgi:hypothetical protein
MGMRSLWQRKRIRAYAYTALVLLAVLLTEVLYAGVHLALASAPVYSPRVPLDSRPLPTLTGPSLKSRIDPMLSQAAEDLAGVRVQVRCWSAGDWTRLALAHEYGNRREAARLAGYAGSGRIHLPSRSCDTLHSFTRDGRNWWKASDDLLLFAHELQHVRGVHDEPTAECYGLQSVDPLARRLGAAPDDARFLAWLASVHYLEDLPEYRSPHCREGGALDLHSERTDWP